MSDHVAVLAALDYGQEERHDRATMAMFAALISSYWADLSLGERRTIAKALCSRPDLSRNLVERFLADHFTVATLIVEASPLVDEPDYYRIADSHVMPMIRAIARRTLPADLVGKLAALRDISTALALALNSGILLDSDAVECLLEVSVRSKHVARALALRDDLPLRALMALYPELGRKERHRVIDLAERDSLVNLGNSEQRASVPVLTEDQRTTLVDLSKRLGKEEFVDRLNGNLLLDRRYLDAMLENEPGEIQAIVFAGLGFSASEATTMFIILGAQEARDYRDIKDLLDLFERVRWRVAGLFLNAWRKHRPIAPTQKDRAKSLADREDSRNVGQQTGDRSRAIPDPGVRQPGQIVAQVRR